MPQVYLTSFFGSGKCCLQVMGGVRGVTKDVAQISIVVYGWGNPSEFCLCRAISMAV